MLLNYFQIDQIELENPYPSVNGFSDGQLVALDSPDHVAGIRVVGTTENLPFTSRTEPVDLHSR